MNQKPIIKIGGNVIISPVNAQAKKTLHEVPLPRLQLNETSQIIDKLNRDQSDINSNFRTIDFNAKITGIQHTVWSWHDSLTDYHVHPTMALATTRALKRNSNSIDGWNKELSVKMVTGERNHKANTSFLGRLKNSFNKNRDNPNEPSGV